MREPIQPTNEILRFKAIRERLEDFEAREDVPDEESSGEGFVVFDATKEETKIDDFIKGFLEAKMMERAKVLDDQINRFLADRLCPHCDEARDDVQLRSRQGGEVMFSCENCFLHPMPKWKRKIAKAYLNQPFPEEPNRGNGAW